MGRPVNSFPALSPPSLHERRLAGVWLWVARGIWIVGAAAGCAMFVASATVRIQAIQTVCSDSSCQNAPLPQSTRAAMAALGVNYAVLAGYLIALDVLLVLVFGLVACLIFARRSDDRNALLVSLALIWFSAATFTGATDALAAAYPAWRLPVATLNFLGSTTFILVVYLLPDGHFVPGRARWTAGIWIAQQAFHYFAPGSWADSDGGSPLVATLIWAIMIGCAVSSQVYRYRHVSAQGARQQVKWVGLGVCVALLGIFLVRAAVIALTLVLSPAQALLLGLISIAVVNLFVSVIPVTLAIAILRFHLFDIDTLLNRTLVYGLLSACVLGVYAVIVSGVSLAFQTRANLLISLLATGVVIVAILPLRERVQRGVNRLLYGQREDPYAVLAELGRRLEATLSPDQTLPVIAETVARTLKLPYVSVVLRQEGKDEVQATSGTPTGTPVSLPLVYQGDVVGALLLSPRASDDGWTTKERRLLDDLAHQAGVAVHAVRLHAELRAAHERLVMTREEERRRIRRDLHDGLGPQLASQALILSAARKQLRSNPDSAEALLKESQLHAQAAITDIRRLVHGLRPPALDDLGLAGALREQSGQYSADGLQVFVEMPDRLPPLSAAVEVALYRIAQEALTNIARHAQAHKATVRLSMPEAGGDIALEVTDDGCGFSGTRQAGVGLASMRERAEELGGACDIVSEPGKGTRVMARLPL